MTHIRVSAEGRGHTFPPGTIVRIGSAPDADVMLHSPAVKAYHARLVSDGNRWWLAAEAGSDVWVTGQRTAAVSVAGAMTALLGARGEAGIRVEPVAVEEGATQLAPRPPTPRPAVPRGARPPAPVPAADGRFFADSPPSPMAFGRPGLAPTIAGPAVAGPAITGYIFTGQEMLPMLVTRIGGVQRVFPVGTQVRVGRDPGLELVSVNPLVSRQCHGVITSDQRGATYIDQSRRGTFLNGKKLKGPLRITESVVLRLGDRATGEELGITPPLSGAEIEHNRERRVLGGRVRMAALVVAAVCVAGAVAGGTLAVLRTPWAASTGGGAQDSLGSGTLASVLRRAEGATVRLVLGSQPSRSGWGSGTVISPTGLILTNAHVAEPQAPGAAVALGVPASQLEPDPPYLTVDVTTGPASPVKARYRARPVAVDGYLDLAVVQIYATSSGAPVSPASLHLPYLPLGNDTQVQLDQPVTVLGFPGVADSDSITVTSGVVSTFVPDPLKHVGDPRFMLETTARLAHGNSGGAAINNAGQLIGVPSLEVSGPGGDLSWRLRSVIEARPLIAAATSRTAYHSRLLKQRTGSEQATAAGVGATATEACSGNQSVTAGASAVFAAAYAQVPAGLDLALLVVLPNGTAVTVPTGGLPQATATRSSGCFAITLAASQLGLAALPGGTYHIQLYGGPNLTPIGQPVTITLS